MRLGYIHTTCQLEVMCINNTRGASELEILSISKSIRVIGNHTNPTFMHYKSQSYLYILEDESVTLCDEFLSVDQLLILTFITKTNDLITSL